MTKEQWMLVIRFMLINLGYLINKMHGTPCVINLRELSLELWEDLNRVYMVLKASKE